MRKLLIILLFGCFCTSAFADVADFTIDADSVRIRRIGTVEEPPPADAPSIDPGMIINIGKAIWQIIEANRPVVDVKQSYATAVPSGITHWTQLAGWSKPQATLYEFTAKNLKGEKMITMTYQVLRTIGGQYDGKGAYLTGVSIQPMLLEASWGTKFFLEASVPPESVANVGTDDEPIASMLLTLRWKLQSTMSEKRGAKLFYLQGDGFFQEIGTGSDGGIMRHGRQALKRLKPSVAWN
ncbi:MAG: hypothetical protein ABIJ96_04880 [Elusimicrobiota bacterium]